MLRLVIIIQNVKYTDCYSFKFILALYNLISYINTSADLQLLIL